MKKKLCILIFLAAALVLPAVRGIGGGTVPFPHGKHLEAAGDCATCHEGIDQADDLSRSYLPTLETCQGCHEAGELSGWGWTRVPARTSGFRAFSHVKHAAQGKDCNACHGALVNPSLAEQGAGVPGHALCTECHDGVARTNDCEDCHSALREGRLQGFRRDPTLLKPMSHHPGFLHDHSFAVRLDGTGCAECHRQEDFCSACHQGENVDFLVHDRNWLYTHPVSARKNTQDCSACHRIGEDCTECHAARGIAPGNHFPLERWRSAAGGGRHAATARRDISICAACHDEGGAGYQACVFCHRDDGVRGNQARLNIHPVGFRDDSGHGYWHDDDQAACFECHPRPTAANRSQFCSYCHEPKND